MPVSSRDTAYITPVYLIGNTAVIYPGVKNSAPPPVVFPHSLGIIAAVSADIEGLKTIFAHAAQPGRKSMHRREDRGSQINEPFVCGILFKHI